MARVFDHPMSFGRGERATHELVDALRVDIPGTYLEDAAARCTGGHGQMG